MNNIFPILLVSFGLLTDQTAAEIKQSKEVLVADLHQKLIVILRVLMLHLIQM